MGFRFSRIDPFNPFGGARVCDALSEATFHALLRDRQPHRTAADFEACIDAVEALIAASGGAGGSESAETGSPESIGSAFVELLMMRWNEGGRPLEVNGEEGTRFGEIDMLVSLALRQCDRAVDAIDRGHANDVAIYMWDIHLLLVELESIESRDEGIDAVSQNARRAAHALHAKTRLQKAAIHDWCKENMQRYRSMDSAAEVAAKLIPVAFRTARAWIGEWEGLADWKKVRSARRR